MSSANPPVHEAAVDQRPVHEKPVRSPCVSICALDDADICTGCQRTVAEITGWSRMDNQQRRAVLIACDERARASGMMFPVSGSSPRR